MDDEEALISTLEEPLVNYRNTSQPLSLSTLRDLQTFLDDPPDGPATFRFLSSSLLLPPLTSAMDAGPTRLSLLSSNAYLSLLLLSPAYLTNFSPIPFLSLLRSLRRSLKHLPGPGDCEQDRQNGPPVRTIHRKKGKSSSSSPSSSPSVLDKEIYLCVLEKLGNVLVSVKLNRFPDVLKPLIQTMVEIPASAGELFGNLFNRLTGLCSEVLFKVLGSEEHGDVAETASEVFKSLTPLVLTTGKSQSRSFALGFVQGLLGGNVVGRMDGVKRAVLNFPKYLARKAPEKAEARCLAVEAIMEVVKAMEVEDKAEFTEFSLRMMLGKGNLRFLAVDLVFNLLLVGREQMGSRVCKDCLDALIERCSDLNAGVRARALMNLAQLVGMLSCNEQRYFVALKDVLGEVLRRRCVDEKANVRRAALGLVTKLIGVLGREILDGGVLVKTIGMACSDPLVSIRRAAILALSEAFRTFSDESVSIEWLHSVPRLITDNEASIQEECENLFQELVLDRVSRAGSSTTLHNEPVFPESNRKGKSTEREIDQLFPERILLLLRELCDGEVAPWVKKICTSLGKKKRLKPKITTALQNIINASESRWLSHLMPIAKWTAPRGAWFLLSEVSAYLSKSLDWEFLHHHWQLLDKYGAAGDLSGPPGGEYMHDDEEGIESKSVAWAGDRVFLLQTISNVSVELPPESAAELAHNLLQRIEKFNMHSTEVNAHVKALRTLCKRKATNPDEADILIKKWVQQVLSKAFLILEKYISGSSEATINNSFFTPPKSGRQRGKRTGAESRSLAQAETAAYTIGSMVIVCPSADTSSIVPVLHTIITSGNPDAKLSKIAGPAVSLKQSAPSLYIQAWLTMGKICLSDGNLAKRYIPLFVQELEKSDGAALRNNLVVMMSDFCVCYTALVDCYISKITKCLRDPCELVRRQTFILLSRLLQRDYVKWRGVLFLRFLFSLVDESEKIRQLADFLFGNILKVKAPLLAYNSFVEAIFVLNDCIVHTGHSGPKNSRTENRLFSIRGNDENSRSKRMHIYVCLLKQMAPEQLLATFAKLCAEILAAASDGMLNVDDITGQSVLQDAFHVLSCKEIRIQSGRGSKTDSGDLEEDVGDGGASAASTAKGRAITQAIRKGLIQNTIPIFIELKRMLENKNSPLTGSLMECLRILLKDYKDEIDDILVADKQLQKELIYDMQKYEMAKARSTAAEAVATMQKQSGFLSPGVTMAAGGTHNRSKLAEKLQGDSRVASAMADVAAAARARSVLKEMNKGASTPPLSSLNVPKLKSQQVGTGARTDRSSEVIESLRRRQCFDSDDEN